MGEEQQLQTELEELVVVEQATGVLCERFRLTIEMASALLHDAAGASQISVRALAEDVIASKLTPDEIVMGLKRDGPWRMPRSQPGSRKFSEG